MLCRLRHGQHLLRLNLNANSPVAGSLFIESYVAFLYLVCIRGMKLFNFSWMLMHLSHIKLVLYHLSLFVFLLLLLQLLLLTSNAEDLMETLALAR